MPGETQEGAEPERAAQAGAEGAAAGEEEGGDDGDEGGDVAVEKQASAS